MYMVNEENSYDKITNFEVEISFDSDMNYVVTFHNFDCFSGQNSVQLVMSDNRKTIEVGDIGVFKGNVSEFKLGQVVYGCSRLLINDSNGLPLVGIDRSDIDSDAFDLILKILKAK